MLEPRKGPSLLSDDDLREVRGGNALLMLPWDPAYDNQCAMCNGNVGNMTQNVEIPPNKLDFYSMIG